jgi:signal transduction histidine kinase/CheY-like chemotaxis protein
MSTSAQTRFAAGPNALRLALYPSEGIRIFLAVHDPELTPNADFGRSLSSERSVLADIAQTTDAFIQAADFQYRWLAINKASADEFEAIYGVRPQVGMSMLDVLADRPDHQAAVKAVWSRALAGEEFTEIAEFGDVERRCYEMKYSNYHDPAGKRIGAFQIVTDVTGRVRAEANLEKAEAALRQSQKMEVIGQLTGGLAHDFNNLLQIIAGNLDLLQRGLPPDLVRLKRHVDNAMRGTARAAQLAHRLLAFARPGVGARAAVDANAVIRGMSDLIRHAAGERVAVSLELMATPAAIQVDPSQLESAILNLVVNARDAMPRGGRLTISTSLETTGDPPTVGQQAGPASIVVGVVDTGDGMDERTLGHLFEPFFTTKEPAQGTGLGLAMVSSFVRMAGGRIEVHSEPGAGSAFRLAFPRAPDEELAAGDVPAQSAPRGGSDEIILVVEDDDDVRQHSVESLRDLGYRVIEAHDSHAALSLLAKHKEHIALMFCDIGLADGENGRELAQLARQVVPSLRVLYTSGSGESGAIADLGADSIVAKPFTVASLAIRMHEMLADTLASDLPASEG